MPAASSDEIADTLGSYAVLRDGAAAPLKIGADSFKAYHRTLRCYNALRVIPTAAFPTQEAREQFVAEAARAAKLRHPSLATVFPLEWIGEDFLYATEFCGGETLEDRITREGHLSAWEALSICRQVASALDEATRNGTPHRSLTPENIQLDDEMRARVLGLGLPSEAGEPDEIHSIGALLQGMLGGSSIPSLVADILVKTLSGDPEARPPSLLALKELIDEALAAPVSVEPEPVPQSTPVEIETPAPPSTPIEKTQPGTTLRLKPLGLGEVVTFCVRESFGIGRAAANADLVTHFLPRSRDNDTKTRRLSKIHTSARRENGRVVFYDGDGLRPSANGSAFEGQLLSAETPSPLTGPGELLLAGEYAIRVIPLLAEESDSAVGGAVLFTPEVLSETGSVLWLFSSVSFVGLFDFETKQSETGVIRHREGCFWIENHSDQPMSVDGFPLAQGRIAPLVGGQVVAIQGSRYSVEIDSPA